MLVSCLLCQFARQLVGKLFLAGEVNMQYITVGTFSIMQTGQTFGIPQVRYKDIGHHISSSIFSNLVNADHS